MRSIAAEDIVTSIAEALQFVSHYHPADFVEALARAYREETGEAARSALLQILINSKLAASARRPLCQDTGVVHVYARVGMDARITAATDRTPSLKALADQAVARAYLDRDNPLRATMVADPLGRRRNTGDNTPSVLEIELVEGDTIAFTIVAKGGGGDAKAAYAMLTPGDGVADWVVEQLPRMGAGWCPPGVLGLGIGGVPEQAMAMAKKALFQPIDIQALAGRRDLDAAERLRLDIFERVNALGIGAQGLGGSTTVLDVKIATAPSHAALLPVALVPNCAATRYVSFELSGEGPAEFVPPSLDLWNSVPDTLPASAGRRVDLDRLTREEAAGWRAGETLLLSGHLLTARDAAHRRLAELMDRGEPLPVDLAGRAIYYVGPVDPVREEAVGPAGPTTSTRMDKYMPQLLERTGLLLTIGKAERGPVAIEAIARHRAPYLVAVGGAAFLVSQAIRRSRTIAFPDLGMEAIREFLVEDMPVTVGVDSAGICVHAHLQRPHPVAPSPATIRSR